MLQDSAWRALSLSGAGPPSHGTEQGPPPGTLRACPPWTRFPETLASPRGEQMQRVGKGTQVLEGGAGCVWSGGGDNGAWK